jgi:hypothetical protein
MVLRAFTMAALAEQLVQLPGVVEIEAVTHVLLQL